MRKFVYPAVYFVLYVISAFVIRELVFVLFDLNILPMDVYWLITLIPLVFGIGVNLFLVVALRPAWPKRRLLLFIPVLAIFSGILNYAMNLNLMYGVFEGWIYIYPIVVITTILTLFTIVLYAILFLQEKDSMILKITFLTMSILVFVSSLFTSSLTHLVFGLIRLNEWLLSMSALQSVFTTVSIVSTILLLITLYVLYEEQEREENHSHLQKLDFETN